MAVKIEENVKLSKYTTFQIGGNADYFCRVSGQEELIEALNWAKEQGVRVRIIGGGSNLLVSDNGYRGLVILNRVGEYELKDTRLTAGSGANLSVIARKMVEMSLSGLDFATGIPGTIGGAVAGNAGAYGKDISEVFVSAEVWQDGNIFELTRDDLHFSYRNSLLKNDENKVILNITLDLHRGDKEKMLSKQAGDAVKRRLDYTGANAGSYFTNINESDLSPDQRKNLEQFIVHSKLAVGKMVEELGLKGLKVGGAMVSQNHGNVILNIGGATAKDVIELERTIRDRVLAAYGILLRPEVIKIGEF